MNDTRTVPKYLRRLERALACPKAVRRPFLDRTRRMAEDFLRDCPEAANRELADLLGEPQELAQGFLETLDPEILTKYRRRKKLICWGLVALAIAAILFLGAWVCELLWFRMIPVEVIDTIIIYD